MKEKIINILGKNHHNPIEFLIDKNHNNFYGLYTFKGEIYVLISGEDIHFDEIEIDDQTKIFKIVESGKWKNNKKLQ